MFVLITITLSAGILFVMYYSSKHRHANSKRKYELVSDLRALVSLCRQHRSLSHPILMYGKPKSHQIEQLEDKILCLVQKLVDNAHFDNKPIYRILQTKLSLLIDRWESMSVSQNQMAHGRSIRHCLLLIDEVVLAWLIEAQKADLSDKYNQNWQQIIDSLETLTQFRIAIPDMNGSQSGLSRIQLYASSMHRRLNQLALISPLAIASPTCSIVCKQLEEISEGREITFTQEQLYALSTDASLIIFNSYDFLLSDIAETIYEPLPQLAVSV